MPLSANAGTPSRLPLGAVEVDLAASVFKAQVPGARDLVGVRLNGGQIAVLDVDRSTGSVLLRPEATSAYDDRWLYITHPPLQIAAALGSQTVVGVTQEDDTKDGSLWVMQRHERGDPQETWTQLGLPAVEGRIGPPVVAVLAGAGVVLLPRGQADVLAVTLSDGPRPQILDGRACDALATTQGVVEGSRSSLGLGCLHDGEVWLGMLDGA